MGDYSGLSEEDQCNHKRSSCKRYSGESQSQNDAGHESMDVERLQKLEKTRKQIIHKKATLRT